MQMMINITVAFFSKQKKKNDHSRCRDSVWSHQLRTHSINHRNRENASEWRCCFDAELFIARVLSKIWRRARVEPKEKGRYRRRNFSIYFRLPFTCALLSKQVHALASAASSSRRRRHLFCFNWLSNRKKRGYTREKTMYAHDEDAAIEKRLERNEMKKNELCLWSSAKREYAKRKKRQRTRCSPVLWESISDD